MDLRAEKGFGRDEDSSMESEAGRAMRRHELVGVGTPTNERREPDGTAPCCPSADSRPRKCEHRKDLRWQYGPKVQSGLLHDDVDQPVDADKGDRIEMRSHSR